MDDIEYVDPRRYVHCARIGGRLHSIGDTVLIPYLGYNGTILRFCEREYAAVIPHNNVHPALYLCLQLERGSGISMSIRMWLKSNGIQVNDTYHSINLPTLIHHTRPHHGCCPIYIATDYSHPVNIHFPYLPNPLVNIDERV